MPGVALLGPGLLEPGQLGEEAHAVVVQHGDLPARQLRGDVDDAPVTVVLTGQRLEPGLALRADAVQEQREPGAEEDRLLQRAAGWWPGR